MLHFRIMKNVCIQNSGHVSAAFSLTIIKTSTTLQLFIRILDIQGKQWHLRRRNDCSGWRLQVTDRQGQFRRDRNCRRWQASQETSIRGAKMCECITKENRVWGSNSFTFFVYSKIFQCIPFLACRQEKHAHVLCPIWVMSERTCALRKRLVCGRHVCFVFTHTQTCQPSIVVLPPPTCSNQSDFHNTNLNFFTAVQSFSNEIDEKKGVIVDKEKKIYNRSLHAIDNM